MSEFEPITTQEEFDERIKSRLAREREKWEKESGTEELRQQLEAKESEITEIKREHHLEATRRAVVGELSSRGVTDEGRIERIMRHVDLDAVVADENGHPDLRAVQTQLAAINRDMPELLTYRVGAGSGGSSRPVLEQQEKPLTREEIEKMSPEEQNRPGVKERIDAFLQGQRG